MVVGLCVLCFLSLRFVLFRCVVCVMVRLVSVRCLVWLGLVLCDLA